MSVARFALLLALLAADAHAGHWRQFLDENGVKGYARSVAGSDILEVRSTMVIPARIEVVGAVLRDVEGLKRPGTSCLEARFVEKKDRNHYTFYVAYDFPWPLSNRDAVIRVNTRYLVDKGRVIADLRAVRHPRVPERDGFVRIRDLRAQFVVEYLGRNRTGVIYTSRMDPAGRIPTFLVNRAAKSNLKDSADDLRRATRKDEYLRAAASSSDAALVKKVTEDPQQMARIVQNRLGELISDRALIDTLVADRRVLASLVEGSGTVGATILHGWGSGESRARAVRALLRELLAGQIRDQAAIERFISDRRLIRRILYYRGGNDDVLAFIRRQGGSGQHR